MVVVAVVNVIIFVVNVVVFVCVMVVVVLVVVVVIVVHVVAVTVVEWLCLLLRSNCHHGRARGDEGKLSSIWKVGIPCSECGGRSRACCGRDCCEV